MANIPIYPGSSSFLPGLTPFGFYDFDFQFQTDADKLVTYCQIDGEYYQIFAPKYIQLK